MRKLLKLIDDNFLFWGIGFLLFFIPLYPKFPLWAVSGTYVHVRLEDIFVAVIVGVFGLRLLVKKDFSFLKEPVAQLVMLFWGAGLLSVLSGVFITKNVVPHIAFLHFLRRVEYISLLFVAYFSLKNIKQLKVLGWITLASSFLVIFYGLGQKFLGWPVVSTMNKEFSKGMILQLTWWARVNSTFAGHYDLAAFMAMILPLTVAAFAIARKRFQKIVILLLAIFSYYVLLLTASRVSFGAFLAGVSFVLWFGRKRFWVIPFLTLSILGMVFSDDLGQRYAATFNIDLSFLSNKISRLAWEPPKSSSAPSPFPTVVPTVVPAKLTPRPGRPAPSLTPTPTLVPDETASESGSPYPEPESVAQATSRSTDIRLKVEWPRALRAFVKNPLLGTGYSSIDLATDNDYLRMLGEIGLLGALAFLALILEIVSRFWFFINSKIVSKPEKLLIIGISGTVIVYFLNATFIDVLEASKLAFFFWILMGVGLKTIDLNTGSQKDNK